LKPIGFYIPACFDANSRRMPRRDYDSLRRETRARLSANIKKERARLGLTQEQTAERVDFSLQYVQRIERSMVNVPLDTVARFAHAFGVSPARLLA
jgi:ribosome-binding protein aMBF1 (putative translation factor)